MRAMDHPPPPDAPGREPQPTPPGSAGVPQRRPEQPTPSLGQLMGNVPGVVEGRAFVSFLKISVRRAFRLRIEPSEVLPSERARLLAANPPVHEPNLQAFLAWRRSVLLLVSCSLVFLTGLGFVNAMHGQMPQTLRMVRLGPAVAEGIFCLICWSQLPRWQHWRKQRRWLFYGWLLFMLAPFVVFVYPLRSILESSFHERKNLLSFVGISSTFKTAVLPFVFAMIAMLQLAPKAISLMPGLMRASMVIKLLFPGSSAPGWLIAMAAPLYALLAYVILIIPYQFTGDPKFIAGVLGVVFGQIMLGRAGFKLARPMNEDQALVQIKKVRKIYLITMILSAGFIIAALYNLVSMIHLKITDVLLAIVKFETNVMTLTMVFSDLVVTNIDRARSQTQVLADVEEATEIKIAAFVGLDAPPVPPPKQ